MIMNKYLVLLCFSISCAMADDGAPTFAAPVEHMSGTYAATVSPHFIALQLAASALIASSTFESAPKKKKQTFTPSYQDYSSSRKKHATKPQKVIGGRMVRR